MKKIIAKLSNGFLTTMAVALVATTASILSNRPEVPAELLKK